MVCWPRSGSRAYWILLPSADRGIWNTGPALRRLCRTSRRPHHQVWSRSGCRRPYWNSESYLEFEKACNHRKDSDFQLCGDLDYAHLCGRPLGKVTLHLHQPFKYKKLTTKTPTIIDISWHSRNTGTHRRACTLTCEYKIESDVGDARRENPDHLWRIFWHPCSRFSVLRMITGLFYFGLFCVSNIATLSRL